MYPYHHVKTPGSDRESVTVFMPDGPQIVANADHPHFAEILEGAKSGLAADELRGLADLSVAVAARFDTLSERVAVANGRVYFDGDEVDSTITKQIVRCLETGEGDWKPLVLFMENVAANPDAHSREQLFDWLRERDFTITNNGCFIAYKGVGPRDDDETQKGYVYQSSARGEAIVNGERFEGYIPNACGAVVEMPRSNVQHDPSHGCSTGLHVGTYEYAKGYASAALLTVLVNPRDVVSVPTECNAEKMRVCRYVVSDDEATHPSEGPAIEAQRAPGRLYERSPDPIGSADGYWEGIFPSEFYVATGETRPANKDEFYLFGDSKVCVAQTGPRGRRETSILVPAEPIHGDEKVDGDGTVYFYLDCPEAPADPNGPRWTHAGGREREDFLAEHESCFSN